MQNNEIYMLKINECKSISKAAKELNISQPALSSALNSLECKLGYIIFNRSTTPISTTQEGSLYIEYLLKKRSLESDLNNQIANISGNENISISIGAPTLYASTYILPAIPDFIATHPLCRIKIIEGTVNQLSELCLNGNIDFFISTHNTDSYYCNYKPLINETLFLFVPKKFIINSHIESVYDISKLKDFHFIFLGAKQPLQQIISSFFSEMDFVPKKIIEVDQIASAIKLSENGCGICFAPSSCMLNLNNDKLIALPLPSEKYNRDIFIATDKKRILSDYHAHFISAITCIN